MTQAAAETNREQRRDARQTGKREHRAETLQTRLELKLAVARKQRSVVRFFTNHRWLLSSHDDAVVARTSLARAKRRLAKTTREIASLRRAIRIHNARLRAARSPRGAICRTFRGYCEQALSVAWCESRLQTTARNGEYLGLFQMGSLARQLFGHGRTAQQQAVAAHRYFVSSGRDWSPWGCKP